MSVPATSATTMASDDHRAAIPPHQCIPGYAEDAQIPECSDQIEWMCR
jgi:hypothetical protein